MKEKNFANEMKKPNYGLFKLKFNPFPMTAINAGGTPFPLYAPRAEELINDFITRTYIENQYGGMIIVGDYGFGKTYLLRWIEKEINEKYSQRNQEAACAIYIENPMSSPRELISTMISHYGVNKYLTMLWGLVTRAFREKYEKEGKKFLNQFYKKQLGLYEKDLVLEIFYEARIMDPMRLLNRISSELVKTKQFNLQKFSEFAYENVIVHIFGATEFSNELVKFNAKGFNASFRDWAALIEYKYIKKSIHLGLSEAHSMRSILQVFKRGGYKRVYLLVDEFEDIHDTLKKEKITAYLRTLRDCIDHNQDMLSLVLALKPAVVDRIEVTYGAFLKRFPFSYRIELAGIMKEAIKKFVYEILKTAREKGFDDMDFQPFTVDGLAKIYEYAGPNPRLILQTCSDLLFEAGKTNRESTAINKNFVQKYYTTAKPSAAVALEKVWITRKVEERIKEEVEGEEK